MHVGTMQQHQRPSGTLDRLKLPQVILSRRGIEAHTTLGQALETPCQTLLVDALKAP
jgi:hypothetical protein